jgi:hypothetical protein
MSIVMFESLYQERSTHKNFFKSCSILNGFLGLILSKLKLKTVQTFRMSEMIKAQKHFIQFLFADLKYCYTEI